MNALDFPRKVIFLSLMPFPSNNCFRTGKSSLSNQFLKSLYREFLSFKYLNLTTMGLYLSSSIVLCLVSLVSFISDSNGFSVSFDVISCV